MPWRQNEDHASSHLFYKRLIAPTMSRAGDYQPTLSIQNALQRAQVALYRVWYAILWQSKVLIQRPVALWDDLPGMRIKSALRCLSVDVLRLEIKIIPHIENSSGHWALAEIPQRYWWWVGEVPTPSLISPGRSIVLLKPHFPVRKIFLTMPMLVSRLELMKLVHVDCFSGHQGL